MNPTLPPNRKPSDRCAGALLALACGDALGAPAEFLSREQLEARHGSLMRTLPVALAYPDMDSMLSTSARISAMTHWDPQAELACAIYCLWIRNLLRGLPLADAWVRALEQGRSVAGSAYLSSLSLIS